MSICCGNARAWYLPAGLHAAAHAASGAGSAPCTLQIRCRPAGPGAAAAAAAAGPPERLELGVTVAPSGDAASLRMLHGGVPLPAHVKARSPKSKHIL